MTRRYYEIGLLFRREFRRTLMAQGLEFQEDKGWLDSMFVVHGERRSVELIDNWVLANAK